MLEQKYCQEFDEKSSFSSPSSNFNIQQIEIIEKTNEKIKNCCKENIIFYDEKSNPVALPKTCNNRTCNNPECKRHREYLFRREHRAQLRANSKMIVSPKGWIATGYVIDIPQNSAEVRSQQQFAIKEFHRLYRLLMQFSRTTFSLHMELKFYPYGHKNYGKYYLHFHFTSGYIHKMSLFQQRWGRWVKYEQAIVPENLDNYISKYSSKVPNFDSSYEREMYQVMVYKQQMHRFSVGKKEAIRSLRFIPEYHSKLIPEDQILREAYYTAKVSKKGDTSAFSQFIESYEKMKKEKKSSQKILLDYAC